MKLPIDPDAPARAAERCQPSRFENIGSWSPAGYASRQTLNFFRGGISSDAQANHRVSHQ
jgi:hypothetical protein